MARTHDRTRLRGSGVTPGSGPRSPGRPSVPRLAVHRSNRHISAQVIDDTTGRTLAAASSVEPELRASLGRAAAVT